MQCTQEHIRPRTMTPHMKCVRCLWNFWIHQFLVGYQIISGIWGKSTGVMEYVPLEVISIYGFCCLTESGYWLVNLINIKRFENFYFFQEMQQKQNWRWPLAHKKFTKRLGNVFSRQDFSNVWCKVVCMRRSSCCSLTHTNSVGFLIPNSLSPPSQFIKKTP